MAEAATRLKATERSVMRWCAAGLLPGAKKVGPGRYGVWLVPEESLEGFERPKMGPKKKRGE